MGDVSAERVFSSDGTDPPWNRIHTESQVDWFEDGAPRADNSQSWIEVLDAIGRKVGGLELADYACASLLDDKKALKARAYANPKDALAELALARAAVLTEHAGAGRCVTRSDATQQEERVLHVGDREAIR